MTSEPMTLPQLINRLLDRYEPLLRAQAFGSGEHSNTHLLGMCQILRDECATWPVDKVNRWVGFLQGVMTVYGVLEVDTERDLTRPLFHAYYQAQGLTPPESSQVVASSDDLG